MQTPLPAPPSSGDHQLHRAANTFMFNKCSSVCDLEESLFIMGTGDRRRKREKLQLLHFVIGEAKMDGMKRAAFLRTTRARLYLRIQTPLQTLLCSVKTMNYKSQFFFESNVKLKMCINKFTIGLSVS